MVIAAECDGCWVVVEVVEGKRKAEEKKGIEKMEKAAKENFYFHFPHPLSRHINNGHFFNAPHMLHADVDAVSSYFSISHSIAVHSLTLFFPFCPRHPPSSDYWNGTFWIHARGEFSAAVVLGGHLLSSLCIFYFIFFDVSFVKKIVISISLVARFCVCYSAKKIYILNECMLWYRVMYSWINVEVRFDEKVL